MLLPFSDTTLRAYIAPLCGALDSYRNMHITILDNIVWTCHTIWLWKREYCEVENSYKEYSNNYFVRLYADTEYTVHL